MKRAAILLLALAAGAVQADTVVGVHTWSWHETPGYSNDNPGVFVRRDGLQLGLYRNSHRATSVYATVEAVTYGPLSLAAGLATGYRSRDETGPCTRRAGGEQWVGECRWTTAGTRSGVLPFAALSVVAPPVLGVSPRLVWLPGVGRAPHTLHLTLETRL